MSKAIFKPGKNISVPVFRFTRFNSVLYQVRKGEEVNPIENELSQLLNSLDRIGESNGEIGDTDVREKMSEAVHRTFIEPVDSYELPNEFGMYSDEANASVKSALESFINGVIPKIGSTGLASRNERLGAFQDDDIESNEGTYYDDYFGYSE